MAKNKSYYKDIYHEETRLVFASILHKKKKGAVPEEKTRIRLIIKEVKILHKNQLQDFYRDYLKLFTIPYRETLYYMVPKTYTASYFKKAVKNYLSDKPTSTQNFVNNESIKEEKENHFLKNLKNPSKKSNSNIKELLEPNYDMFSFNKGNDKELLDLSYNKTYTNKMDPLLKGNLTPNKITKEVKTIERNHSVVTKLKRLYGDQCQICRVKTDVGGNEYYSEVHHIQPLGAHRGPDIIENMIVLCPNHHVMFDKGAITIDLDEKEVFHANDNHKINNKTVILKHDIEEEYIKYHNLNIWKGNLESSYLIVEYGDTVIFYDGEEINQVTLESYYNRFFMNNMQRMLLKRKKDETFLFNGYHYQVVDIKKDQSKLAGKNSE